MAPKNKESVLNRGAACLECRKRKLKCDAAKVCMRTFVIGPPYCGACVKSSRQDRCIYEAIRNKNLADQLEERVNQLERMVERMEREGSTGMTALSPTQMHGSSTGYGVVPNTHNELTSSSSIAPSGIPMPLAGNYGTFMPLDHKSNSRQHYLDALITLPWDDAVEAWSRLPDESHNSLVDIFITYLPKSNIQLHVERFLSNLALPDDNPRSIHPAMLAAVYLLACYHWSDSLMAYEAAFLAQARTLMQDALAKKDRLFTGFIQPGILVTEYLLNRGRMNCNLHKLKSSILGPMMSGCPSGLLPPPTDGVELGERILAFWAAFMLDQKCCIMGLPSSFGKADELDTRGRIDTVWVSITDIRLVLMVAEIRLYTEMAPDDVGLAISQFIRRLPAPDPNDPVNMPSLAVAHIVSHAAMIRLCARSSATQTMDGRALEASLSCYIWADCAKILARYIKEKEQGGALAEGTRLRPALAAILAGLARAGQVYSVISEQIVPEATRS
ncbi:fungal zn(2)-Cys(6) binuclear cluster domain-containing protein [Rhizoctonia solani AG-1 IA]|uniref:Fungal zn(2)-Cys(6) binuclear cluster domain-containing protein n=1 Tax=Thanatephorus cucumeris (strain AG1-IA) TaxID=983506 RepID=L8WLK7_THACA|nr:fungal zn(2)-Cys(6) binuclear cluster domain-containing protein [Rhizoctonia solani AG-1 IA]